MFGLKNSVSGVASLSTNMLVVYVSVSKKVIENFKSEINLAFQGVINNKQLNEVNIEKNGSNQLLQNMCF